MQLINLSTARNSNWFIYFVSSSKKSISNQPGAGTKKILKHKFYATQFLSILFGWPIWESNQNAWKNSVV